MRLVSRKKRSFAHLFFVYYSTFVLLFDLKYAYISIASFFYRAQDELFNVVDRFYHASCTSFVRNWLHVKFRSYRKIHKERCGVRELKRDFLFGFVSCVFFSVFIDHLQKLFRKKNGWGDAKARTISLWLALARN